MPDNKKKRERASKSSPKNKGFQNSLRVQVIFLVLLVFILYGNTLLNKYSLDDEYVILNNKKVEQGIKGIPDIFTSRFTISDNDITYGYRPVVLTTFAIEYELFGYAPGFSHFINVLLFALSSLLLFLILRKLFNAYHYLFPLIVTTIFIAHPIHTEVVASLKNRDEFLVLFSHCFLCIQ